MTGGGYGNENVKKAIGLDWPNNNSAVLNISLPSLQDYDVNLTYFHVFWSGVNSSDFLLLFLVFDSVLENLTPEKFTNIRQIKRDGINAIRFEAAQIHFLSDVFVAVSAVDA